MGSLRFRRSVSICKGVRLNFGKKGVSISSGIPGFRKTYNFNTGKTTTSVGIPGTGIYYVDTSGPSKKKEEKKSGGFFSDLFGGNQNSSPATSNNATSYCNTNASQRHTASKPAAPVYPVYGDSTVILSCRWLFLFGRQTKELPAEKSERKLFLCTYIAVGIVYLPNILDLHRF